jgi:hypothetical protein
VRRLAALIALAAPAAAQAQEAAAIVRFIACPIYRDADSGKKSGCWLADDRASGVRYDVSQSPYKPDWNHEVLVEGRLAAGDANPCGGKVLEPVRTSILPGTCPRHMLPAEGYPGRRYKLQGRYIQPLSVAREVPPGPYAQRTFPIYFEFDRDFLIYQYDDYLLDRAVTWIRAAKPKKLVVTGFAATEPEAVSGRMISERAEVASLRAHAVAETLRRLMPELAIEVRRQTRSRPIADADGDGIPGQSQRRAEILAVF